MKCFLKFFFRFYRQFPVVVGLLFCCVSVSSARGGMVSAMKAALEKNPAVLAARDKVAASQRDLASEQYQRLPTLSFEVEVEGRRESEGLLRMRQPLWVGGRISNAAAAAGVELAISQAGLIEVQRGMMEDTAVAYAKLLGLKIRLGTAERNLEEHQRLLDLISRRKKGKISSGADVSLARARVSYAALLKEELMGEQKTALADLMALTLEPCEILTSVPESLLSLPGTQEIESYVIGASPAVRGANLAIKLAKIQQALNRSELMPMVYGRLDQELYDRASLSNQDLDTRLGLVVEGSFEGLGLSRYELVKAAEIRMNRAKRNKESEENEVRRSTCVLLADRETLSTLISLHRERVTSSAATLASYLRQYEAGRKNWLDLLNIQQENATARLSLEAAKSSLLQNTLRLLARTGRLDQAAGLVP